MKVKNATSEDAKMGWYYDYKDLQQLKAEVEKINEDGCSMEQLHDVLDIIDYREQQSQLRLLADAVLENHTNCCDACPEGDIHACSGFAIIGVVNCCQCEACKIAREVRGECGA